MNQENPIDELFRRKLGQTEAPVADDMWSRIAAARQPEQQVPTYRPYWLWGSLMLTSLLVLGLWLGLRPNAPQVTIGAFPLATALPVSTANAEQREDKLALDLASDSRTVTGQSRPVKITPSASANLHADSEELAVVSQVGATELLEVEEVPAVPDILPPATTISDATLPAAENLSVVVVFEDAAGPITVVAEQDEAEEGGRIFGPHRRRQLAVVETLPTQNFQQTQEDLSRYLSPANRTPQCAKFARNFLRFDLEVLGGPAYAHQQLNAKTSESTDHLNLRLASEQPSLSFGAGVRLSAISRTGLGIRMGLNYNQINERFEYMTERRMDIQQILDVNTGEVIRIDTAFIAPQAAQVRNRLKMVEIPLMVTYETQWKQLRLGFNLGAALNLWFDASGKMVSPVSGKPIAFGQVGDRDVLPIFETQASAAVLGSISFAYSFHNRWSLVGEPYLRTHPRAFSNQAYNLTQNYWQTGVQLGLRMRL